ncbi:adenylate/guanylate cyclase domain-containing protein [Candidatus Marinimicrobia bacterium]|nr:adenylate/guanylate cyclase domain-containing protein [Candidatus Neomarinimicrobiota bacterium]
MIKNSNDISKIYEKFPDQNPNPVMRSSEKGDILYFNNPAIKIIQYWEQVKDRSFPKSFFDNVKKSKQKLAESSFEIRTEKKFFLVKSVYVEELKSYNIYFQDITAKSIISKFPDQNPNPVMQVDYEGHLIYHNEASNPFIKHHKLKIGSLVSEDLLSLVGEVALTSSFKNSRVNFAHSIYDIHLVPIKEFDFIIMYCTDVTAEDLVRKFPDQNPNPVLRFDKDFILEYYNDTASYIIDEWGVSIGQSIDRWIISKIIKSKTSPIKKIEHKVGHKTFSSNIVFTPQFNFYLMYSTDISESRAKEMILGKLSKYFSPQVFSSIFTGELDVKIDTRRKNLTIFFSDIKGFTSLTEKLEPEQLTNLIADYLTEMTDIAMKYGGTVDKYIGDAIMIFFGDPDTKGIKTDAVSCVKMALEMLTRLSVIKKKWESQGISDNLSIRIGIHSDICTVGNFGSKDRLDYTVLGNGVNLASRLEGLAKPNTILISDSTYNIIKEEIDCAASEEVKVKGKLQPIKTYKVNDVLSEHRKTDIFYEDEGFLLNIEESKITNVDLIIDNLKKSILKLKLNKREK